MKYECVTVWHKTSNGTYKKFVFKHSVIRELKKDSTNASSVSADNSLTVRIFDDGIVSPGDRLDIGKSNKIKPSCESYIISSVTDSRTLSDCLGHIKAVCN